ncbi:MAG TPA: acetylglutamate kinase [Savagea sp.]
MTTSKSTDRIVRDTVVIKLGGSMLSGLSGTFFTQLKKIQETSDVIIVHGGGPAISAALERHRIPFKKINGLRVTSEKAATIVKDVLTKQVNRQLVQTFNAYGVEARGLSGADDNLLTCQYLDKAIYGQVGTIESVQREALDRLHEKGVTPVVSCIGTDAIGNPLNINGDDVATAIAQGVGAKELLFVTDVEGVLVNKKLQKEVTERQIELWMEDGTIYGGMIPKVQAALTSLRAGVPVVQIANEKLDGTSVLMEEMAQ